MNDTIRTQLAHSSVRAFTNEPVTAELRIFQIVSV